MAMLHMVCHWKVRIMQHFILIKDSAGECADQISQEDKACWDKKVNTHRERTAQNVYANSFRPLLWQQIPEDLILASWRRGGNMKHSVDWSSEFPGSGRELQNCDEIPWKIGPLIIDHFGQQSETRLFPRENSVSYGFQVHFPTISNIVRGLPFENISATYLPS